MKQLLKRHVNSIIIDSDFLKSKSGWRCVTTLVPENRVAGSLQPFGNKIYIFFIIKVYLRFI